MIGVAVILAAVLFLMSGCGAGNGSEGAAESGGKKGAESSAVSQEEKDGLKTQADKEDDGDGKSAGAGETETELPEEVRKADTPPDDFDAVGEYQDEVSKRAMMTIMPEGEEDHYTVEISWGSSAFETTIWEFEGDFDYEKGMLAYSGASRIELYIDDNGKQQEKVVYEDGRGWLYYSDGGIRWYDINDELGRDCRFIKMDDLSYAIIEEDDE